MSRYVDQEMYKRQGRFPLVSELWYAEEEKDFHGMFWRPSDSSLLILQVDKKSSTVIYSKLPATLEYITILDTLTVLQKD